MSASDRNPWSSCPAYAQPTPNSLVTFHPGYLGAGCDAAGRQGADTVFLAISAHEPSMRPRRTTKRALRGFAFLAQYGARRGPPGRNSSS
jgi:hypothetical protein